MNSRVSRSDSWPTPLPPGPAGARVGGGFDLTETVFALFSTLIEARTGIHYEPRDRPLLAGKLEAGAAVSGATSPLDYYYLVRDDPASGAAFDGLIDAIVVNETYFFREAEQLTALCEGVLAPLCRAGKRPRVWSAACATGEEPLTLAMMLDGMGLLSEVDIVASDIGRAVLARAKAGGYGERSVRLLPRGVMGRWLTREDGNVTVLPRLHEAIDWRRVNLVDAEAVGALGTFDAILCRNVFIYFGDETIRRVVQSLTARLNEHAPLLVGAAESLLQFDTGLKWTERCGAFFHVRS